MAFCFVVRLRFGTRYRNPVDLRVEVGVLLLAREPFLRRLSIVLELRSLSKGTLEF